MRASDFHYDLPEELIAQEPLADRSASRLLVLHKDSGQIEHRAFSDLPEYLRAGDLLVLNDTRVSAVRLLGHRPTGGKVEALLLTDEGGGRFVALTRPAKKLRPGDSVEFAGGLVATIETDMSDGKKRLVFVQPDFRERIGEAGSVPLPPYIRRRLDDPGRYQTVYALTEGSAAAPTAGLHFTQEILDAMGKRGIESATVTLDVGLDTFRQIAVENIEDHVMHGERCAVPVKTAEKVNACKGRVVAVGTTTVRTLESFAVSDHMVESGEATSTLFIVPGYGFKVVDVMLTNFHMPGTTLMLLVSAFAGRDNVMRAYEAAVERRYRFLSFGDAMLIE